MAEATPKPDNPINKDNQPENKLSLKDEQTTEMLKEIAKLKLQNEEFSKKLKISENEKIFNSNGFNPKFHDYLTTLSDKYGIDEVLKDKNLDIWKKGVNYNSIQILNAGSNQGQDGQTPTKTQAQVEFEKVIKNVNEFSKKG